MCVHYNGSRIFSRGVRDFLNDINDLEILNDINDLEILNDINRLEMSNDINRLEILNDIGGLRTLIISITCINTHKTVKYRLLTPILVDKLCFSGVLL